MTHLAEILWPVERQPGLSKALLRDLRRFLRADQMSALQTDRLSYGRDACAQSTLWVRQGQVKYPPELIVWPETVAEVASILSYAQEQAISVVPYGAGSGVCGGTWALCGGIALDLKRLNKILRVDTARRTVQAEAGISGELLERELQRRDLTLGHFPSSIYVATLGGYLACRSAGQFSSKYGKIEDMVEDLEVVLPTGEIVQTSQVKEIPGILDLNEVFVGSEGVLGALTKATLRLHQAPATQKFLGFSFGTLEKGMLAIRQIMQAGLKPAVLRLYDELDSWLATSYPKEEKTSWHEHLFKSLNPLLDCAKDASFKLLLDKASWFKKALDYMPADCLLILGFEGEKLLTEAEISAATEICQNLRAKDLGEGPGRYWLKHRYSVAYKLSPIFDKGMFADTMEVATTWTKLSQLYEEIRNAIKEDVLVLAHFSHAYPEGCSIYFTFVGYRPDAEALEALYQKTWEQALQACVRVGGTISHHHGVGLLKSAYMKKEWGQSFRYLEKLKVALDPKGISNPGKLGLTFAKEFSA